MEAHLQLEDNQLQKGSLDWMVCVKRYITIE